MKILQTILQKTFYVNYCGKIFYVDYLNSDSQTSALLNRDNWIIYDDSGEELNLFIFHRDNKKQKYEVEKNFLLAKKLIEFCIKHFNDFDVLEK